MINQVIQVDEQEVVKRYGVSKLVGKLIAASSLSEEQIDELLHGKSTCTPSNAACVLECVSLLKQAKENQEKVFIAGDFDCDGICATSILKYTFEQYGIEHGYYIPNRLKEGYGLSAKTVKMAIDKGYTLFITCDNGIKCFDAIEEVHKHGAKIIVTDHHTIEEEVPSDLLVHPDVMEDACSTLCGAGVALQLSRHLIGKDDKVTALAAVASIGDVMPLWKETRCIVKEGFQAIAQGKLPSVLPMLYRGNEINKETVGFNIVPRINAVGRLSDEFNVNQLIPFLISDDRLLIENMNKQLNACNAKRKAISNAMVKKAESMMQEDEPFIILHDDSFHLGICGLAAGKLAHTYQKPTIIMAPVDGVYRGSGRSIEGFNLFEFFASGFEEYFEAFGGHKAAVGMSVKEENFDAFIEKVREKLNTYEFDEIEEKKKGVLISENDVSVEEVDSLLTLVPYPKEMVDQSFAIIDPTVSALNQMPKVTKYHFVNNGKGFDGIVFPYQNLEIIEQPRLVSGKLSNNRYKTYINPQMMIEAIIG